MCTSITHVHGPPSEWAVVEKGCMLILVSACFWGIVQGRVCMYDFVCLCTRYRTALWEDADANRCSC